MAPKWYSTVEAGWSDSTVYALSQLICTVDLYVGLRVLIASKEKVYCCRMNKECNKVRSKKPLTKYQILQIYNKHLETDRRMNLMDS